MLVGLCRWIHPASGHRCVLFLVFLVCYMVSFPFQSGSNLGPGASCWKAGSYLLMPGGLQCSMHWFPPPVKATRRNMTLAVERDVKQQINLNSHFNLILF